MFVNKSVLLYIKIFLLNKVCIEFSDTHYIPNSLVMSLFNHQLNEISIYNKHTFIKVKKN